MRKEVKIMGIVNVTPDSFYSGARVESDKLFISKVIQHIEEGGDIIDIGAYSTRPGADFVPEEEEWKRLEPKLKLLRREFPGIIVSVDTFRAEIVKRCFDTIGIFIVNDISAGEDDPQMLQVVGRLRLEYIAMHKKGDPRTMQRLCQYPKGVTEEVLEYFRSFEESAAEAGISEWILDPGFGFAKDVQQNLELLERLSEFKALERRVLVGISRKSFIYKPLNITPEEALEATTELHIKAINHGADILRVHDVGAAKKLLTDERLRQYA